MKMSNFSTWLGPGSNRAELQTSDIAAPPHPAAATENSSPLFHKSLVLMVFCVMSIVSRRDERQAEGPSTSSFRRFYLSPPIDRKADTTSSEIDW